MIFEKVRVYANCDDATIIWKTNQPIPGCRGFALERKLRSGGVTAESSFVPTWVGFEGEGHGFGESRPSTVWPIQRYIWTDYLVRLGQEVRYRVIPMIRSNGALEKASKEQWSEWTDWVQVKTGKCKSLKAYFNRGIVPAQWLARLRREDERALLEQDIKTKGSRNRDFLGGELRRAMLDLLRQVKDEGLEMHAALYELNDPELIEGLKVIGSKCHLILGSGAYKGADRKHNKPAVSDENAGIREDLREHSEVDLHDRLVRSPHFAHNKFVVVSDKKGLPSMTWTGSTNWTVTGLCTQTNNGLLIESKPIAEGYLKRWNELKDAGDGYPKSLAQRGSSPSTDSLQGAETTVWHTPTVGLVDLADARKKILAAKQGVLFLMLNPGPRGSLLNDILSLNPNKLIIHGVVNQDPGGKKEPLIMLTHRGETLQAQSLPAILPEALKAAGSHWFGTEFTFNMIMIHSKVIVIDPFGHNPIVMTGSHNMGPKASKVNDDNLVIAENAPSLAEEYAVNIMGIYGHFKWRYNQYLKMQGTKREKSRSPQYDGNKDDDEWQEWYRSGSKLREINFWLGIQS